MDIPITTTNLDQPKFTFTVSAKAAAHGVAFHITITAMNADLPSDSTAGLAIVTEINDGARLGRSTEPVKPTVEVALKKEERVWKADLTVSNELLQKPGLRFVFTETAHAIIDGKSVAMPSATFYEIKLRDFVKQ